MEMKIEYSTYRQTRSRQKREKCLYLLVIMILVGGLLFLRHTLVGVLLPEGKLLESVAMLIREQDTTVAEAVAVFYRGIISGGVQ